MSLHRLSLAVLTVLILVTAPLAAWACDFDDEDGLDVALVLSGGGAKASTQVGVMQVLDELEIPIHCITGTSMGSVVGAFYATGYSSDEIADILTQDDWGEIFRGQVPRRDKSFIAKEREENYFSGNVASLSSDGLSLPGGLSSMQGLKNHYRNVLSHVPLESDFDRFDIPFRAVATDLSSGDAKAFARGDLVEAILASMAVPGLFAPREIDGNLYVDGGISSTLPVQLAKQMGADIIIALDVSVKPQRREADISVGSVANQLTGIMVWRTREAEVARLSGDDLLILPNTINIGTSAYAQSAEGLVAGRAEAALYRDQLLAIKAKAAPARVKISPVALPLSGQDLKVVNNTIVKDELITRRLDFTDNPMDTIEERDRRLRNLASFGGFGEVDLGYSQGDAVLRVDENVLGRNLLQIGFNASNDFIGNATYSMLGRLTRKPLGPHGGDLSLSVEFGTDIGLSAEIYQPFGPKGAFFVQPEIFATWKEQNIDLVDTRLADLRVRDVGGRARIGREIGAWGVVAVEGEIKDSRTRSILNIGEDIGKFSNQLGRLGVYAAADTLNRNDWPTTGHRARLRAARIFVLDDSGTANTRRLDASYLQALEIKSFGVLLNARYGDTRADDSTVVDPISLGGFRQLSGLRDRSLPVSQFKYGSVEVFRRLTSEGKLLDLPIYVGGLLEYGDNTLSILGIEDDVTVVSGAAYLGIDTPIGPMFLGTAYGNNDDLQMFFKLGRTF